MNDMKDLKALLDYWVGWSAIILFLFVVIFPVTALAALGVMGIYNAFSAWVGLPALLFWQAWLIVGLAVIVDLCFRIKDHE